jgi:hypothetical protein
VGFSQPSSAGGLQSAPTVFEPKTRRPSAKISTERRAISFISGER